MKEPLQKAMPGQAKAVDWARLRERLEAARGGAGWELTPEEQKDVLRKRAKTLAQPPLSMEAAGGELEVLEFLLSFETYAVEIACVAETYPLKDITPLPGTPPFVAGIINVRGRIVSVVDIRKFFDLPEKGLTNLNKVIILHGGDMEFGILADEVIGTRSISLAEVQPSLPTLSGIREEYLKGVTRKRTTILDGARMLVDGKLIVREEPGG